MFLGVHGMDTERGVEVGSWDLPRAGRQRSWAPSRNRGVAWVVGTGKEQNVKAADDISALWALHSRGRSSSLSACCPFLSTPARRRLQLPARPQSPYLTLLPASDHCPKCGFAELEASREPPLAQGSPATLPSHLTTSSILCFLK